jgi:hypothetical protein
LKNNAILNAFSLNYLIVRNYQKQLILQDDATPILNLQVIDEQSRKDDFFGIITNVKNMTAVEIIFKYIILGMKSIVIFASLKVDSMKKSPGRIFLMLN